MKNVWYCADCGSPNVYDIQPTADASGRTALGKCGIAGDDQRHGCSFRGTKSVLVPLVQFQSERTRKPRVKKEVPIEAFPGADFSGRLL